jgi:hypothetical protein
MVFSYGFGVSRSGDACGVFTALPVTHPAILLLWSAPLVVAGYYLPAQMAAVDKPS